MKQTCHDCGVYEGQIHEFGCDMERCPFCGNQLISCNCLYEYFGESISENGLNKQQEDKWLEILERKGRVPYILFPNICGRCGQLWPDMFMVPNDEWEKYIPIKDRDLIICKKCWNEIKKLIDTAYGKPTKASSTPQG